jgi:hypothetical protein
VLRSVLHMALDSLYTFAYNATGSSDLLAVLGLSWLVASAAVLTALLVGALILGAG